MGNLRTNKYKINVESIDGLKSLGFKYVDNDLYEYRFVAYRFKNKKPCLECAVVADSTAYDIVSVNLIDLSTKTFYTPFYNDSPCHYKFMKQIERKICNVFSTLNITKVRGSTPYENTSRKKKK